jgi:hypothetical protein
MKKSCFFLSLILLLNVSMAQWTTTGNDIYNSNTGNVGVGTNTPASKLVVNGKARIISNLLIGGDEEAPGFEQLTLKGGSLGLIDFTQGTDQKMWQLRAQGGTFRIILEKDDYSAVQNAMVISRVGINTNVVNFPNGSVGIGTSTTGSFKLAVEGKIGARGIKVTTTSPWPDYVFNKGYKLISIDSLDRYVKTNAHLPNMPSAKNIQEDGGVELGDMNVKMLEKMEELTLYIIQLKKENEAMKRAIKKLSGRKTGK